MEKEVGGGIKRRQMRIDKHEDRKRWAEEERHDGEY